MDFRLPQPRPTAGLLDIAGGFAAGEDIMQNRMRTGLIRQKMEDAAMRRQALLDYGRTGDIKGLMAADPAAAAKIQESQAYQRKIEIEALKPGLDYLYVNRDSLKDPNQYAAIRANALKISPMLGAHLPETFDPKTTPQLIDRGAANYERYKKLEDPYKAAEIGLKREKLERVDIPVGQARIKHYEAGAALSQERIDQGWAKITLDKEKERKGGPYYQLTEFYKQLHPDQKEGPTEDQLHDLFVKFSKSGTNLAQSKDMKIVQQAMANLNKNVAFRDMDPNDPKREAMIDQEIARMGSRFEGGKEKAPKQATYDQSTFYNTFKAALTGPNRDAAIAHAQQNDPEFIERAKKEGLIK